MKRLLLLTLIFAMLPVASVSAEVVKNPFADYYTVTDEYEVIVPAGTSGTFSAKTKSGATKYVPPELGSAWLATLDIRFKGKLDSGHYITVTFGDGHKVKYDDAPDGSSPLKIPNSVFVSHPSRGVTITLTTDGRSEKYAKVSQFGFMGSTGGNTGGDTGGGNNGGGGNTGGGTPSNPRDRRSK